MTKVAETKTSESSGKRIKETLQNIVFSATLSRMRRTPQRRGPWGKRQSTRQLKATNPMNSMTPAILPPALSQLAIPKGGPESLTDLELIELVLSLAVPEERVKKIAFALLIQFGSYAKAISAPNSELEQIKGLGRDGIVALRLVLETMVRTLRAEVVSRPIISNWNSLIKYLTALYAHESKEKFHCLFLDTRNRLICDEVMAEGTVNALTIYPREVVKRALALHATALIMVHNHPTSGPKPSRADLVATQGINEALSKIGIVLHDSIIVAGTEWYSFREDGIL